MDAHDFAKVLMDENRKTWQDPEKIISSLGISEGMTVADLGCGPGFFTVPISKKIGTTGKIFAVDSNKVMLDHLRENLASLATTSMNNVSIMEGDVGATRIPSESVDLVLFSIILHDIQDKERFLCEAKRVSKIHGKIVDIDWHKRENEVGPPLEKRLSEAETRRILRENGLLIVREFNAGQFHYGFECRKRTESTDFTSQ